MRNHRRARAAIGAGLLVPLAATLAGSVGFAASCEYDCGDQGGRGLLVLTFLCTPPKRR
jgi:hypothetical protein